ncbi:MAG: hypothetical protein R3F62_01695 [Planctomycetota bacterium]
MLRTLTLACALAGTCLAQVGPLQLHHDADLRRADAATWRGRLAAEDPAVRAAAARGVGRIREASLAAQVEARLVLPEPVASVRRELVFALGQLKAGREALEAATADDDLEVRAVALEALGKLPAADTSAERLVAGLAGEESEVAAALLAAARAYGRRVQPPPTAPEAP